MFAVDVRINYNQLTKEVTCNGVKIVNMKNGPLVLSEHKTTIVKLEEETFIQFDNLRCEVKHFIVVSNISRRKVII